MEEHKGTITIDTAPGRGTTMLLRFPTITPPEEDIFQYARTVRGAYLCIP